MSSMYLSINIIIVVISCSWLQSHTLKPHTCHSWFQSSTANNNSSKFTSHKYLCWQNITCLYCILPLVHLKLPRLGVGWKWTFPGTYITSCITWLRDCSLLNKAGFLLAFLFLLFSKCFISGRYKSMHCD